MRMRQFSIAVRNETLPLLGETAYDVLVIGGGITGAGVALDAVSRGLRVCLIEKSDFASGTSSKSTKLIHGGLRYLKNFEFGLVREVGKERAILHRLAPHLVRPAPMLLPIYSKGTLGKVSTAIALTLYDRLAAVKEGERFRMLKQEEALELEPLLKVKNLIGGALYKEYVTDDARLTLAVLKTAAGMGADCLNFCRYDSPVYEGKRIAGAVITDEIGDVQYTVRARYVVNAAGPWVDGIRKTEGPLSGKFLHLTKGIHIVVAQSDFPLQQAVYFDVASDKRMIFAIPRGDTVYIGTTDTTFTKDLDAIDIEQAEVQYLLNATNSAFDKLNLTTAMVQSAWAGLRPLIGQRGKSPGELSRKDALFISGSGMLSIAGGKLTGYRKMAEKVVDKVVQHMGATSSCRTDAIALSGADFSVPVDEYIERRGGEAGQVGFTHEEIRELVFRYGTAVERMIENGFQLYHKYPDAAQRKIAAEIQYAVEHEMVSDLNDFLIRRTGMLYFEIERAKALYPFAASHIQQMVHLPVAEYQRRLKVFETTLTAAASHKNS